MPSMSGSGCRAFESAAYAPEPHEKTFARDGGPRLSLFALQPQIHQLQARGAAAKHS